MREEHAILGMQFTFCIIISNGVSLVWSTFVYVLSNQSYLIDYIYVEISILLITILLFVYFCLEEYHNEKLK